MNPSPINPNKALWEKGDFTRIAASMRESGEALVNNPGVTKGLKVLDLGCGDGTTALPEAKLGAEVLAGKNGKEADLAKELEALFEQSEQERKPGCHLNTGNLPARYGFGLSTMKEKLQFVRLPILLFIIFFVGRLVMGAVMGVDKSSYDLSNRIFSMVILQVHVGLLWGAVGRRYRGYDIGGSISAVVLAVAVSQLLIFAGTAISYLAGINTLFTFPEALNQQAAVSFGAAMLSRTITFIANCVFAAIAGAIGWALGGLLPAGGKVTT